MTLDSVPPRLRGNTKRARSTDSGAQLSLLGLDSQKEPDPRESAKQQRRSAREARVRAGMDELDLFLRDLLRQGLATLSVSGYRTWDEMAARLVDAQAPGLARFVRELGATAHARPGWQDDIVRKVGRLHLLIEAFRRIDSLPDNLAAEVRSLVGFSLKRDELLREPPIHDIWWVPGRRLELVENLTTVRTWYWGTKTHRFAMVLSFGAAGRPFDAGPRPGSFVDARLHYHPSTIPLRAIVDSVARTGAVDPRLIHGAFVPLRDAWTDYLRARAALPWLDRYPAAICDARVGKRDEHWVISDSSSELDMQPLGDDGWTLLAMSGGNAIEVFGEFHGTSFVPYGAFGEDGHVVLATNPLFLEARG